jgi:formamidopyrimidine-DNA glycosylase
MPEYLEILANHNYINSINDKKYNSVFTQPISKYVIKNTIQYHADQPFQISSEHNGKQIALSFMDKRLIFSMGMSGGFIYIPDPEIPANIKKHAVMIFRGDDHNLVLHDIRRFAKWVEGDGWGKDRGPDPIANKKAFQKNIIDSLKKKTFEKPIYEVLMDQKYFSGIGNYLRAMILYRSGGDIFSSAKDYITQNHEKFFQSIDQILLEGIQYLKEGKDFPASWYYPYFSSNFLIDRNNRRFWFHK